MKRALLAAVLVAADALAAGRGSVVGSKHDLSVTGPGPIKAVSEPNACVFCHVVHGGGGSGLSSRPDPIAPHRPYESSTMKTRPGTPSGTSRICLSCHDGTIAVGQNRKQRIEVTGTPDGRIPGSRRSNLGTDLRESHPLSVPGTSNGHGPVKPDAQGLVQCTSCHDPHSEFGGSSEGRFLLQATARSELCAACHDIPVDSGHLVSTKSYVGREPGESPYETVAEAGCMACHRTHGAAPKGQLLRLGKTDPDENVCLRCHGSSGGGTDVGRELAKGSSHAVSTSGRHDAAEGPSSAAHRLPEVSVGATRHATCVDCHNPHEARNRAPSGRRIAGALDGVWGVDEAGHRVEVAQYEFQICFKCHGDSANQRAAGPAGGLSAVRAAADLNLRRVFGPMAASSHPVVSPGRNPDVPSLRSPLTPASMISCSDCHASDDSPSAGGAGARGPHGSMYRPLLERNYTTADFTSESPTAYALCYKCHDRAVLLSDDSAFRLHAKHVVAGRIPCSACHAAHGVSGSSGSSQGNAHLIDYDLSIVRANAGGLPYSSAGRRSGSCNVTCHDHGEKGRHDSVRY